MTVARSRTAWLFLLPFIVGFLVFQLIPLVASAGLVFHRYDVLSPPIFTGLDNIEFMLSSRGFWNAWRVTLLYAGVGLVLTVTFSLGLALLLYNARHLKVFWRVLIFIPAVLAGTGEALMLTAVFAKNGLVNAILDIGGIDGPNWLNDTQWALPALILARYWTVGPQVLFFLGARAAVPADLYEVARIDGAGHWASFRNITLPMMTPMILFNTVLGIIIGLQSFTQVFIMTKGGPAGATELIGLTIYREAFEYLRFGYASALSWTLFIATLGVTALLMLSARRWVYYEAGDER